MSGQPADRGWGCGWRNIQMQVSHLLLRPACPLAHHVFGGCGFVPDIVAGLSCCLAAVSLQAWLEAAWEQGWDVLGSESLGSKIQGDSKWIGTTEAAALLRYHRISARIIDFP
ncbi:uncharacterized protein HaLaN_05538, partial [Haematococcus lacustris]